MYTVHLNSVRVESLIGLLRVLVNAGGFCMVLHGATKSYLIKLN